MPSFQMNTPLASPGPLAPGASQGFFSVGLGERSVAYVTAMPTTLGPGHGAGNALAVENLRVVIAQDQFGDAVRQLHYAVKNVGSATIASYTVNVVIFFP